MMPADLCRQTRKVQVSVDCGCVTSFVFYDCSYMVLFSVGALSWSKNDVATLEIGAGEMIIGFKASLYYGCPGIFTDFAFMICDKD